MKPQNHEDTIMRAYVWSLHSNGKTIADAREIARKNINMFNRAEILEIQETEGHSNPISFEKLAEYTANKYLTSFGNFIKEAQSKEDLHDLEAWWQKHQVRISMNISEADFNEFAIETMPALRSKFEDKEQDNSAATVMPDEVQAEECTDLVVSIDPKQLVINDNFSIYAEQWRAEMRKADFLPQAEEDLKDLRNNEKKCREVEKAIDGVIDELSGHLEEVGKTDPKIKEYTNRLVDNRKKLRVLKEETVAHRKKISHAPKRYMDDQKKQAVEEHFTRVNDTADQLFVGEIAKGRNDVDVKSRLVAAYKGKRTVDTIRTAIEEEADRIIAEMNERASLCRSNLKLIEAAGRPAIFQDKSNLMTLDTEILEQQITIRLQQDDLLQFCGEHKQKLKAEYAKSVNSPPPPEEPQQERVHHAANHVSPSPQHEERHEEPPTTTDSQEAEEEAAGGAVDEKPEEIKLALEFTVFGTKEQVKKIANDVFACIRKNPLLQADKDGNTIVLRRI